MVTFINKTGYAFSAVLRTGVFLLIWWALTDGTAASWWIGLPAVLLAVITSFVLLPPVHFVWYESLRFIPFFLTHSLTGGIDVAWRVFHPSLPISPDIIKYPLRLPAGVPQVFMAITVNLLPGTLSLTLQGDVMQVHVLNSQRDYLAELEAVELKVARLFALTLATPEEV